MNRITMKDHPADLRRGKAVRLLVDGQALEAFEGESIAAALAANGIWTLRHTARLGQPRGIFCGMGVCHECALTVDGQAGVRACLTAAADGMVIETGRQGQP